MKVKIKKLHPDAVIPAYAKPGDAGMDLTAVSVSHDDFGNICYGTGLAFEIPEGYVGLITSKSGLMLSGITSRGTIDSSYRGSIRAVLYNSGSEAVKFEKGRKITQLVIVPCLLPEIELVNELSETDRGDGGFGSTGA